MSSRYRTLGKKARKPRGIKKDGTESLDLCDGCYSFNCDPSSMSRAFIAKRDRLREKGLCVACGHNPCTCKSSLKAGLRHEFN
jgi:hypothetical protein